MILEWLEGRSLADDLAERRRRGMRGRSLAEAFAILEPVVDGLAAAHRQQVAHRDVKPANVFLLAPSASGRHGPQVKVLDFGIAKIMKEGESAGTKGTFASFTWAYAAPEQLDSRLGATGLATDVYAFALLVTELLSDRDAVDERDVVGIMKAAIDPNRRPTPRTRGANIPDEIESVCRRALAVDPKSRYASISELWAALVAARDGARAGTMLQPVIATSSITGSSPVLPRANSQLRGSPPAFLASSDTGPFASSRGASAGPAGVQVGAASTPRHGAALPISASMPVSVPMSSPSRPPGLATPPLPMSPPPGTSPLGHYGSMMPYAASPPLGTLPPGQSPRRMHAPRADGTSPVAVVTIVLFVIALLFAGSCALVHGACNAVS
jgi:eukaryotic-like serine/threonine-protein kinase